MRKLKVLNKYFAAIALTAMLAVTVDGDAQETKAMRISAASLLGDLVQSIAMDYSAFSTGCKYVVLGSTTGKSLQQLFEGDSEICAVTRPLTDAEKNKAEEKRIILGEKFVGYVAMAIVVNKANKVDKLTMEQLAKIFKGEITDWSRLGGSSEAVRAVIRPAPETGAGVLFQQDALKGAPYAKDAVVAQSYGTMLTIVAKSPGAVCYMPTVAPEFRRLDSEGAKVLTLTADDTSAPFPLPTKLYKDSPYPIRIPFYLNWNSKSENSCVTGLVSHISAQIK